MSMPVTTFYCTKCDFRQGDAETWGSRVYVTSDNRTVQVPRRLGWCEDCGGLASVETYSESDIRKAIREIEDELQVMPSEPSRQPWEVFKYLPFSGWDTKVQRWHYKQDQLVGKLDETTTLLGIVKQRKSPPRCLECGSTRALAPLVPDKSFWDSKMPAATGFVGGGHDPRKFGVDELDEGLGAGFFRYGNTGFTVCRPQGSRRCDRAAIGLSGKRSAAGNVLMR